MSKFDDSFHQHYSFLGNKNTTVCGLNCKKCSVAEQCEVGQCKSGYGLSSSGVCESK